MPKTPLKSARRGACGHVDDADASPTCPTGEQKQKKRTYDVLPKPDNLIRYRQAFCPTPWIDSLEALDAPGTHYWKRGSSQPPFALEHDLIRPFGRRFSLPLRPDR